MTRTLYAVRAHPIVNEDDWPQGTVMYTTDTSDGPWHDMLTGPLDYCWEALDALQTVEELNRQRQEKEAQRLRAYAESGIDRD